jgi:hypothetical protein
MIEEIKTNGLYWTRVFLKTFGIYLVWLMVHYGSAHLYTMYCVPTGITGFIQSILLTPSYHCQALRWAVYNGGNHIGTMWSILGVWISMYLTPIENNPMNQ